MPLDSESEAILDWLKAKSNGPAGDQNAAETAREAKRIFGDVHLRRGISPLERLMLPPTRPFTADDVRRARNLSAGWDDYAFQIHEVETWLRAGLEPHEAGLAALLIEEGITPDRLAEQLTHPSTGERLTVLDVVHRVPEAYAYNAGATLCSVLDQAGVERVRGAAVLPRWLRRHQQPHAG